MKKTNRKIEKKTWPEHFQLILNGRKTFDARIADFKNRKGDILILQEWEQKTKKYTGRKIEKNVTHVLKTNNVTFWPKKKVEKYGLQLISIK